jgi:heme/copper-type cytochrome/quinol oxidase subunit 1
MSLRRLRSLSFWLILTAVLGLGMAFIHRPAGYAQNTVVYLPLITKPVPPRHVVFEAFMRDI